MFLPYLNYGNILWGRASSTALNRTLILQKRVIRILTHADFRAHTPPLFKLLNLLRLPDIVKYQTALFMYKYHKHILPQIFDNMFFAADSVHSYNTRYNKYLRTPFLKSNMLSSNSIILNGSKLWNNTPSYLKKTHHH